MASVEKQGDLHAGEKINKKSVIKNSKCYRAADNKVKQVIINLGLTVRQNFGYSGEVSIQSALSALTSVSWQLWSLRLRVDRRMKRWDSGLNITVTDILHIRFSLVSADSWSRARAFCYSLPGVLQNLSLNLFCQIWPVSLECLLSRQYMLAMEG